MYTHYALIFDHEETYECTHNQDLFSLLKPPEERRDCSNVHRVTSYSQDVIQDPSDFSEHGADVLCSQWNVNPQKSFYCQGIGLSI